MADLYDVWAQQNPGANADLLRSVGGSNNNYTTPSYSSGYTAPTAPSGSNMEELQREWARQTGSDYNLLFGGGGNTQTTGGTNTDLPKEYGWGGNLPGTDVPSLQQPTQQQTSPTQTPSTNSGYTIQDYFNYYGGDWRNANMGYDEWVAWMNQGGNTPTNPTSQTGGEASTGSGGTNVEQGGTGGNTVDAMTEWQQIMARVNAGNGTIADYYRLQQLAAILSGGTPNSGSTNPITGTPSAGISTGVLGGASMIHELPPLAYDRTQAIRDMYDAQINAERAALQEQGNQALSDAQANRDKIAETYNKQRNAASVDWERQRRNFLEGAASSGLNTGAGSQAELSMMSTGQRSQNDLGAAQAQAEIEADRNIEDIKRSTQAAINEAVLKNDYQKAAALLDEYNQQYNREMDRAEALASFGDFSGYANIYGEDAARQMASMWAMQNPEIALAMGLITQQQYAMLTLYKQYPALAMTGGGGYSGGSSDPWAYGGSGWDSSGTNTGNSSASNASNPTMGNMSPATYAAYINSLVASGELDGATGQALIREAYAFVP